MLSLLNEIKKKSLPQTLNNQVILFVEQEHLYYYINQDGEKIQSETSVTKFVDENFHFGSANFNQILDQMVARGSYRYNAKYFYIPRNHELDDKQIKRLIGSNWETKKQIACDYGTMMHAMFENYYISGNLEYNPLLELETKQFRKFLKNEGKELQIYGVEIRLFDPILRMGGSIDALFTLKSDPTKYVIVDWKRVGNLDMGLQRSPDKYGNLFRDSKLKKYSFQVNIYRELIETFHPEFTIYAMMLMVIDPTVHDVANSSYEIVNIPKLLYLDNFMKKVREEKKNKV